ncbi:MAG: glycosyltransferase family 2 protein [Janthinobacterium lividum]
MNRDPSDSSVDLSIVVCTRNRAASLGGMLRSLAELHNRHSWEVILADNASSDDTAGVIGRPDPGGGRLRYMRVDRVGLGAARDAAWRQASGRIIAFTDDYLAPDYVDAVVGVFDRHAGLGCLGGRILLYDPRDAAVTSDERTEQAGTPPRVFADAGILHGANLLLPRSTLVDIGGFDSDLGAGTEFPCEDIDVVTAVLWSGRPALFHPAPVVWHHHGRRVADIGKLFMGYDKGRGAYFAKHLLRPDTRSAYLRGWWAVSRRDQTRYGLVRITREMRAAFSYLRHKKAYGFLAAAMPVAAAA